MIYWSSSLHGGQVSQHNIHCVYRVGADGLVQLQGLRHAAASQHLVEHMPADQRHKLDGNFEGAIFPPLTWESDIQVHLRKKKEEGPRRLDQDRVHLVREGVKWWLILCICVCMCVCMGYV